MEGAESISLGNPAKIIPARPAATTPCRRPFHARKRLGSPSAAPNGRRVTSLEAGGLRVGLSDRKRFDATFLFGFVAGIEHPSMLRNRLPPFSSLQNVGYGQAFLAGN